MHEVVGGALRGTSTDTRLGRLGLGLIALLGAAMAHVSCGSSGSSTVIDLTVTVDPLLAVDTVDITVRAPGKPEKLLTRTPTSPILVNIFAEGLSPAAAGRAKSWTRTLLASPWPSP